MAKKYVVTLKVEEREQLLSLIGSGNAKARTLAHARILLKADEGWQDPAICKALNVSIATIERVRKQFVFEGFEAALKQRRSKRVYRRKVDGEQEARLVALVCSSPPEGYARWSLRLLADRVVQMKIIDSISHETVRQVLDENELKPWRRAEWCIPKASAEFVFHMEDVLDVYKRPAVPAPQIQLPFSPADFGYKPNAIRVLRILARLGTAHKPEIASLAGLSKTYIRTLLKRLQTGNLIERKRIGKYQGWAIRNTGLKLAHRSWNLPKGAHFKKHRGEFRYAGERHRRVSRMWRAWLESAYQNIEIWDCWTEVPVKYGIPDALAWGTHYGKETLFW